MIQHLDPIIQIALSKPIEGSKAGTLADLRQIAERLIKKDLEAMDGVAVVRIRGGFESETQCWFAKIGCKHET